MYTNDEKQPLLTLTISGNVDKFATISPNRAHLDGVAGTKISRKVSIISDEKYPFNIIKTRAVHGEYIKYTLEEDKNEKVRSYVLTIENLKTDSGRYFDTVVLETDSNIQPHIKIGVYGNIRPGKEAEVSGPSGNTGGRK